MAGPNGRADYAPASALISTDTGLEEFTLTALEPDVRGVPMNVTSDTEYAILTGQQSRQYWQGDVMVQHQDTERYPGAFAVRFAAQDGQPETVVQSYNRASHIALIEEAMRAR